MWHHNRECFKSKITKNYSYCIRIHFLEIFRILVILYIILVQKFCAKIDNIN